MSLEKRIEALMTNNQAISTSNQELKAQNEYLREQLGELMKRKQKICASHTSSAFMEMKVR